MKKFIGWTIIILVLLTITAVFAPIGIGLAAFIWWSFAVARNEAHENDRNRQREERQQKLREETSKELAKMEAKKNAIRKTIRPPLFWDEPMNPGQSWAKRADAVQLNEWKSKQDDALRAAGYNPNCYGC